MEEYFGEAGKQYEPLTKGKRFLLMPAISRQCPLASGVQSQFLDVACGTGMASIAISRGYRYVGIDASELLLQKARTAHPEGRYILGSATALSEYFPSGQFETILMSMLLPALDKREDVVAVLKETHKVLADNGTLLIGVTHPSFDWYMQAGLFQKKGVDCDFKGYFSAGERFVIHKGDFEFHDAHWTLADYVAALREAGFVITMIDECPPSSPEANEEFIAEKSRFPTYLLIVAQKRSQ